jgi:hypothetical protein
MSIERALPPARAAARVSARVAVALLAVVIAAGCDRGADGDYVALASTAPSAGGRAEVRVERCGSGWCEGLWVAPAGERAVRVSQLSKGERTDEIAWTKDSARVAFLVNGHQLWLFNVAGRSPAGRVNLVEADAQPTTRVARGVTFSDNGAAMTFDDCPRGRSGCKPGMIAIR